MLQIFLICGIMGLLQNDSPEISDTTSGAIGSEDAPDIV